MNSLPIGIFDSGLGGLTVLKSIQKTLPQENLIYLADNKYLPYGKRTEIEIIERSLKLSSFLTAVPVKAIVVACNTATAVAIASLRQAFTIPIIGVEPGIKPACEMTNTGQVGVLATQGTLGSEKYENLKNIHGKQVEVHQQACTGLVSAIESEYPEFEQTKILVKKYLQVFKDKKVDVVVLGCTHYPLIEKLIQHEFHQAVTVNTGPAIARQLKNRLSATNSLNELNPNPCMQVLASDANKVFQAKLANFLQADADKVLRLIQLPEWVI